MQFSDVQWLQLVGGLLCGGLVLTAGLALPLRTTVPVLIVIAPFQLIESPHGSVNMVVTYLLAAALLLRGELRRAPLIAPIALLALFYLFSLSQTDPALLRSHTTYLITLAASFLMFFISYNYFLEHGNRRQFVTLMFVLNGLVLAYCLVQLVAGDREIYLGTREIALHRTRADQRLTGPFYAVGMTAEFFVIQIFFAMTVLLGETRRAARWLIGALLCADLAMLIATGNRGGFLVLLGGLLVFMFLYRREVRSTQLLGLVGATVLLVVAMSAVVVRYTDFNLLYERLAKTELREGVPDSRQKTWSVAWRNILDRPLVGHGPRFRVHRDRTQLIENHPYLPYPHSLYLFLAYTVGVLGLAAFLIFLAALARRITQGLRAAPRGSEEARFLRLGLLILILFSVDQIKMEFLRFGLADYQQFIFFVFGAMLAFADRQARLPASTPARTVREIQPVTAHPRTGAIGTPGLNTIR